MRLHPQRRIQRGHLRDVTRLGTPSDSSAPADRTEQAHELTRGKAFTAEWSPTGRAGRPGSRLLRPFGQSIFNDGQG
jgi:hypothetical protein